MVSEEKRKAIIDMADFATSMFLYILAEHEDSSTPANCDPTHKPSRRRKHTDMVKPLVKFRTFCVQVLWHTRRSPSTIILSLRFLHQIVSNLRDKNKRLTSKRRYEKRFFIGVLILADKFHNDGSLNNDCWSWLTGISMGKIRSIERQFLEILDYKVFVCAEEYTEWLACLVSMTKRHMPTQISVALEQQSIAAASIISPIDHTTTTKEPTPSIPKTTTTKEPTPSKPKTTTTKKPTPSIPKTTTTKEPTPSKPKTTTTKEPTPSKPKTTTTKEPTPSKPKTTTTKEPTPSIRKTTTTKELTPSKPKTTTTKKPTPSIPKTTTKVVSPTPPVIQQDQGSSRRSDKASGSNRHPHLYSQKDGQSQGIEQSNSSKAPTLKSTGRAANAAATAIVAGGKRTERLASASYTSKATSAAARHPTKATTTSNVPRPTNPARP